MPASTVFDLYSFYLEPDTDVREFRARDGAWRLVRREIRDRDGRRRPTGRASATISCKTCDLAAQFGLTCSLEFAVIRPLATLPQTVRLIDGGEARRRDLHRSAAPGALGRQPGRREGARCEILSLRADLRRRARAGRAEPGAVRQARARHARDAGRRHAAVARAPRRAAARHSAQRRAAAFACAKGTSARDWAKTTLESTRNFSQQG